MKLRATIVPEHPVIFIYDPASPYEPQPDPSKQLVTATPSCIAVGTIAYVDGEVTIELGVSMSRPLGSLVFEGKLQTPRWKVAVTGSDTMPILSIGVRDSVTGIKIWANDPRVPNLIQILVDVDFSEEMPFCDEMNGVDQATAKRLIDMAQRYDALAVEIDQIVSSVEDPIKKDRLKMMAALAASDIQDGIVVPAMKRFPDLLRD